MKKVLITLSAVLVLVAVGLGVYVFMLIGERNDIQEELTSTQGTLVSTQQELHTTLENLSTTGNELAETQESLDSTQATLDVTEETLDTTRKQLASTEDGLKATEDELPETKDELADTKGDLTLAEAKLDNAEEDLEELEIQYQVAIETLQGLDITLSPSILCFDVVLVDNPDAVNPTWAELKAFLLEDTTEQHEYIRDEYDCSQFSRDLHNHAEAAGIRAAEVQIVFKGEEAGHALNAFLTTDYGLVFVDSTGVPETVARVKADKSYRGATLPAVNILRIHDDAWWNSLMTYYYIRSSSGSEAVVSDIAIYW